MTLTSFLDVKADPSKPDETKVDLLKNLDHGTAIVMSVPHELPSGNPLETVEYVELYNHHLARRRRLCRALAWLLAVFLLLDIGVVLYIGLRMRHTEEAEQPATVTCRLRFRSAGAGDGHEERTEQIRISSRYVLIQPMWAADGHPTMLINLDRGYTVISAPSSRTCFIRASRHRTGWSRRVLQWAKVPHDVQPEQTRYTRLTIRQPAISLETLMSYGNLAWEMCRRYETYIVEPVVSNCPMYKCAACPSGVYHRDVNGCPTCICEAADQSAVNIRSRRDAVAGKRRTIELDVGVLPGKDGRAVHTIDVIEF